MTRFAKTSWMGITWTPKTVQLFISAQEAVLLGSIVSEDRYSMIFSKPVTAQWTSHAAKELLLVLLPVQVKKRYIPQHMTNQN